MPDSPPLPGAGPTPGPATSSRPRRPPWWIPRFLGPVPEGVTREQVSLIGTIALALVFEYYDISMLGSAARYIRESFDVPQSELGTLVGLVRLGAVPALLLVPFADRVGRRRLFLLCVVGMSLATALTAFTASAFQFVAVQMVARTFLIAGSAAAFVIVAEELPAEHRGWAIGILGALGSFGFGLGALLFAAVDVLPGGWRALYLFGAAPLLLLPRFRRDVRETRRFTAHQARSTGLPAPAWWRPFAALAQRSPGRFALLASIGILASAGHGATHGLLGDFVLTDHGWSPRAYSAMFVLGGTLGIIGNTAVGRLADRFGRRRVALGVLGLFPAAAFAFYQGPGWLLAAVWIPLVFFTTGGSTLIRALATELFPTAARGTATGSLSLFEALGSAGGLFLVSASTPLGASNAQAVSAVACLTLLAGLAALALPETARRELEDISADGPAPGAGT